MIEISPLNIVSTKSIKAAKELVLNELNDLQKDYFPELTIKQFMSSQIYPDSRMLLLLQYRCLYKGIVEIIVGIKLFNFVKKFSPNIEFFHISFLRVHHVNQTSFGGETYDNFLAGALHYDNYTEVKNGSDTLTTWIPFQDINHETGSLATTSDPFLIKNTANGDGRTGLSPKDFHNEQFVRNNKEYIETLKIQCKTYNLNVGQCILFDKTVLHGSTYPVSKDRISFDLRWKKTDQANSFNDLMRKKHHFKKDALENLFRTKDRIFITRNLNEINKKFFFKRLSEELKSILRPYKKICQQILP